MLSAGEILSYLHMNVDKSSALSIFVMLSLKCFIAHRVKYHNTETERYRSTCRSRLGSLAKDVNLMAAKFESCFHIYTVFSFKERKTDKRKENRIFKLYI